MKIVPLAHARAEVSRGLVSVANALRVGDHLMKRMGAGRCDEKMMPAIS